MFSEIDNTIFPDSCEVIFLGSSQLYVFPIMKNGSSSFYEQLKREKRPDWKIISNKEITKICAPIIVFVRSPKERFISGVNTYLQHLQRDYPDLDQKTILWFVNNYLFLNRHYCPQFYWLINLARYINPTTPIQIKSMSSISEIANMHFDADVLPPTPDFLSIIENFNWKQLELYFFLDQLLLDKVGSQLTVTQLFEEIQDKHSELYNLIFKKTQQITNVLS